MQMTFISLVITYECFTNILSHFLKVFLWYYATIKLGDEKRMLNDKNYQVVIKLVNKRSVLLGSVEIQIEI